jgi:hypothetical protein
MNLRCMIPGTLLVATLALAGCDKKAGIDPRKAGQTNAEMNSGDDELPNPREVTEPTAGDDGLPNPREITESDRR